MFGLFRSLAVAGLLAALPLARAAFDLGFEDDGDLYSFVTRPELRSPRFNVTIHSPDEVTPGYWFIAPYATIMQERFAGKFLQPCQTGPAIYDSTGELVWTGACVVKNQNTCDFRMFEAHGKMFMSAILSFFRGMDDVGHAVIMDHTMEVIAAYATPPDMVPYNMHEFKVVNNGRSALHIVQKTQVSNLVNVQGTRSDAGLLANQAIREVDLQTGETLFEWWVHDHVPFNHSNVPVSQLRGPFPNGWDWLHLNAVDKDDDGDYLVTARFTDAIYKVSGKEGKLLWTLGGTGSSFVLDGFNVSGPHDGRFIAKEGDKEYISFLDNGGDETRKMSNHSTGYLLELDQSTEPYTARVAGKWVRPDGKRSERRGNFQLLENGNAFGGWSDNCYISEQSPDGRTLMEAQFASERFVTYRAYKFNFTSRPTESPALKAFVFGDAPEESMSVYYVSWNGATDVASWDFFDAETNVLAGRKARTGFETMYSQSRMYAPSVYAEAIAADGTVLGRSDTFVIEPPGEWALAAPASPEDVHGTDSTADIPEPTDTSDEWNKEEL